MTTYEKIVKGATKVKVAAPKPKYIEPILMATSRDHPSDVEDLHTIIRTLQSRLQDSSWSVVYKSLIVIHIMIREGEKDVTLDYINKNAPGMLNLSGNQIIKHGNQNSDVRFLLKYGKYLNTRVKQFNATGIDYVRDERSSNRSSQKGGRLKSIGIERGLLRESESVQKQIDALLKSNFMENEITNDILLTAFRLLVNDLLALFQELNEGVINILEHYFEMSKVDAERALKIYKKFVDQTKYVIDFLRVAKHLEHATKLHVPTIKHAPTALTSSLEEYLNDPNFESNRRQYLAEKKFSNINTLPKYKYEPPEPSKPDSKPNHSRNNSLMVQQTATNPWLGSGYQFQTGQISTNANNVNNANNGAPSQTQQTYLDTQTGAIYSFPVVSQGQSLDGVNQNTLNQNTLPPQTLPLTNTQAQIPTLYNSQQIQQNIQPSNNQIEQVPTFVTQNVPQALNHGFTGNGFGGYGPQINQQTTGNPFMQSNMAGSNFAIQNTNQVQQNTQVISANTTGQISNTLGTLQGQMGLSRTSTNPFMKMNPSVSSQSAAYIESNPFGSTRFSQNSGTTALSFNNDSPKPIAATSTGSNPFKVSQTTTNLFNRVSEQQNQLSQTPLKSQPTAGGLENIATIPVFPETRKDAEKHVYLNNARAEIQMQGTGYQQTAFPQQQAGFPQYQIQQNDPIQNAVQTSHYDGPSLI